MDAITKERVEKSEKLSDALGINNARFEELKEIAKDINQGTDNWGSFFYTLMEKELSEKEKLLVLFIAVKSSDHGECLNMMGLLEKLQSQAGGGTTTDLT